MHRYIDYKIRVCGKVSKIKYLANSSKWKAQGKGKIIDSKSNELIRIE